MALSRGARAHAFLIVVFPLVDVVLVTAVYTPLDWRQQKPGQQTWTTIHIRPDK